MAEPIYEFLKDYLDLALKKSSRKGATRWAMLGAIAALAWYILGKINIDNAFAVWMAVSFVSPCALLAALFGEVSRHGSSKQKGHYRILKIGLTASANRQQGLAFSLVWFALLISYGYLFRSANVLALCAGGIFPFLFVIAGLSIFKDNLTREYSVENSGINSRAAMIVMLVVGILSAIGLYYVYRQNSVFLFEIDRVEWRMALGFVAAGWLSSQLMSDGKDELRLRAIEAIWIEHSIGEIDAEEAKIRVRQLIHGARIDEVFGGHVAKFQEVLRRATEKADGIKKINDAVQSKSGVVPEEVVSLVGSALPGLKADLRGAIGTCDEVLSEMNSAISKYSDPAFKEDALEIHKELGAKLMPLKQLLQ
jgi:hypothetical protein